MFSDTKRGESSENRSIERYLILGIVALIPISTLSIRGHTDLDAGIILSIFILPITLRTTIKSRMPRRLLVLLLLALVCGPVLTLLATSTPARSVDQAIEIETLFLVLSFCISIPTVYWSVVKSGWAPTLNAFAVGAIAQGALNHSAWNGNAWKYVFAWPVVALILPKQGWGSRSRAYGIVVVVALTDVVARAADDAVRAVWTGIMYSMPSLTRAAGFEKLSFGHIGWGDVVQPSIAVTLLSWGARSKRTNCWSGEKLG